MQPAMPNCVIAGYAETGTGTVTEPSATPESADTPCALPTKTNPGATKRRGPVAPDHQVISNAPIERGFRIGGATEVAVVVMADRQIHIEFLDKWNAHGAINDGNFHLAEFREIIPVNIIIIHRR